MEFPRKIPEDVSCHWSLVSNVNGTHMEICKRYRHWVTFPTINDYRYNTGSDYKMECGQVFTSTILTCLDQESWQVDTIIHYETLNLMWDDH